MIKKINYLIMMKLKKISFYKYYFNNHFYKGHKRIKKL